MSALKSCLVHKVPNFDLFMFSAIGDNWDQEYIEKLDLDRKYLPSWNTYLDKNKLKDNCCWHPKELAHSEMAEYIIKTYGH